VALKPLPRIEDAGLYQRYANSPFPTFGEAAEPADAQIAALESPSLGVSEEQRRMQEIDRMLQEAQTRALVMEREAYDKAYATGEKSGMALGSKRAEQTLDQMQTMLKQAELQLRGMEYICREAVLDIAEAVVQQVLGEMSESNHAILLHAVEKAAFQFPDMSNIVMMVHPDDMNLFESLLPGTSLESWPLRARHDVEEGTCRLMSEKQDVLVNPMAALRTSFELLRQQFQA